MSAQFITFLSDYGSDDEFVGVVHGVIAMHAPDVRVLDITHGVTRHDVRAGALLLASSLPYMPAGVHLAVVDPQVGHPTRRGVAVRTMEEQRLLVGPDNGLLMGAAQVFGGVSEAVDISHSELRLEPVSATFHGRDIFAPVAAALASGTPLAATGEPFDPDELAPLVLPTFTREGDVIHAHVLTIDTFGNVTLNVDHTSVASMGLRLGSQVKLSVGGVPFAARYARVFGDVDRGELLLYEDSQRRLALAVNRGSAASNLDLTPDDEVQLHLS